MTFGIDNYPYTLWNAYSADASNISAGVSSSRAYANSLGVADMTTISNVDIIASTGNAETCIKADSDVIRACGIGIERIYSGGGVVLAGAVIKERSSPNSRISAADGIRAQRISTGGRIRAAVVVLERPNPAGRVR